ncbi:MAG: hypothetical protein J6Y78_11300 [Paludibacteraceae bacterium]|nr:hypothetical protein [Paludibacteraceae bacterium]
MARYIVTFECLLPVKVDTVMEAEDPQELIFKLEKRDIGEFHFKTIGEFRDIREVIFKEVEDE